MCLRESIYWEKKSPVCLTSCSTALLLLRGFLRAELELNALVADAVLWETSAIHVQPAGIRLGHTSMLCGEILSGRPERALSRHEPRAFWHGTNRGQKIVFLCMLSHYCFNDVYSVKNRLSVALNSPFHKSRH